MHKIDRFNMVCALNEIRSTNLPNGWEQINYHGIKTTFTFDKTLCIYGGEPDPLSTQLAGILYARSKIVLDL